MSTLKYFTFNSYVLKRPLMSFCTLISALVVWTIFCSGLPSISYIRVCMYATNFERIDILCLYNGVFTDPDLIYLNSTVQIGYKLHIIDDLISDSHQWELKWHPVVTAINHSLHVFAQTLEAWYFATIFSILLTVDLVNCSFVSIFF